MKTHKAAQRMEHIPPSGIREVFDAAARLQRQGKSIINFQIGRPDFDTPGHIKEASKRALDEGFVHYTPNAGIPELREAIAHKLKAENDLVVDPERELIVTVGANEAIALTMLALVDPGDEVIIANPSWPHYYYCVRLAGGIPISVPLREENGFQLSPDDVEDKLTPRTRMLVINTPQNPTGSMLSRQSLAALGAIVEKHGLLVIADEVYDRITYTEQTHVSFATLPGMRESTLTINAFSKTYSMTGWRIGYVAAPAALIQALIRVHQYTVTSACSFAQKGAVAALTDSQECVRDMVGEFKRRRDLVVDGFQGISGVSLVPPTGALYAFPRVDGLGLNSEELCSHLLHEAGVAVVPGSVFGRYGEGHLRLAFSCSTEDVAEGMRRIASACRELI